MERIHVSLRARPLSLEDAKTSPWRISGNSIALHNYSSKFDFDRIFGEDCKTREVYEARTRDIVSAAVRGFNGTVFAYGQTNSGKTHTMRGSRDEPGIIPLAVNDLFDIIHQEMDREFLLRMSYLEIYNEDINDLLAPEHRKLQIHESLERGIYVAGLREEIVASSQQVLDLMEFGEAHRHIGETNMNLYSSRSHTIFRMIIESRERTSEEDNEGACDAVRVSVLNLVDLAGSERAAKTGAEGVRLKEGSHINKSLMTLGTVIKKLSEGAENQGGHVPYRDSKLTRILQPALGGNANTAMICNITLAQIHADETKSSLQFASRALRVTNYACVNEILTDAALLKRQKKEIEELRAKLQGSHSEHLEEEILNLRNTLLKSELERERIALELEEEKKAQAHREKVMQEQAKKIKNLSSMVLYSNREENCDYVKKAKRRDTWCPGKDSWHNPREVLPKSSASRRANSLHDMEPLFEFDELVNEHEVKDHPCKQVEDSEIDASCGRMLLGSNALLHVTNRRKAPAKKRNSDMDGRDLAELQAEYEELLMKYEAERTEHHILIDVLRSHKEAGLYHDLRCNEQSEDLSGKSIHGDKGVSLREAEAIIVIKQLQEKINMLEMEKSSSQQNLDNLVAIAEEQKIFSTEKLKELQEQLSLAQAEVRVTNEQLVSRKVAEIIDENSESGELVMEFEELESEVQSYKVAAESVLTLADDILQGFHGLSSLVAEFSSFISHASVDQASIVSYHERLHEAMAKKVTAAENQKKGKNILAVLVLNESDTLKNENEEIVSKMLLEQHDLERSEFLSYIQCLEVEISNLSACWLAKEKESMRKDLEKTKTKLKETESKLKNVMQEKTRLEGEKAFAEKEVKRLHGQKALLERDISKRDSIIEKNPKGLDTRRGKLNSDQLLMEDYNMLEVLTFEMETKIGSLEEELAASNEAKLEAECRNENLASEVAALSEKLDISHAELDLLQKENAELRCRLEEFTFHCQKLETSVNALHEEKEELAMQLGNSLLEMEEERAIWSAKEKASIEAISEKATLYNKEIMSLSKELSEVRNQLESCREECIRLTEKLTFSEENAKQEKESSMIKSLEIDRLQNDLKSAEEEIKRSLEFVDANAQVEELNGRTSELQVKMHNEVRNGIEKAKLRRRLRGTQGQLDAVCHRYNQSLEEMDLMHKKFEEASKNLKEGLASKALEVLELKKQLAFAAAGTSSH